MSQDSITATVDRAAQAIVELINSKSSSPSKEEIMAIIAGRAGIILALLPSCPAYGGCADLKNSPLSKGGQPFAVERPRDAAHAHVVAELVCTYLRKPFTLARMRPGTRRVE
jgi:hypothetical protein